MKLSFLFFGNKPDEKWELCKQMGIRYAIAKLSPELTGVTPVYELPALQQAKDIFEQHGFTLCGLEGDQFDMNRIKFGLPGREKDTENYCRMLQHMGASGIHLLCYNFMAGIGWYRTHTSVYERGNALVSAFRKEDADKEGLTRFGILPESQLWENYHWFIEQVMPVAESAGVKMALHPDDPPVSPLRGIARIFTSSAHIRKALSLLKSPSHGLTFCQGTYTTMGEDPATLIDEFGTAGKIFFIHIRDVQGHAENFRETFHDNGPTDMVKMFEAYKKTGIDVPLRSDHVPTLYGEDNLQHGYGMKGNLFGIGYIKGIMDSLKIPVV